MKNREAHLTEQLLQSIRERNTPVTIKDIAAACGVGVTTVSRAINDQPDVAPARKALIKATAKKLGYRPNRNAQQLRNTITKTIAVLIKGPSNPFFLGILDPLEKEIRERGFNVMLVRVNHSADEMAAALQACADVRLSGIIFMGGWTNRSVIEIEQLPVPAVLCTVPLEMAHNSIPATIKKSRVKFSSVAIDDFAAIRQIVHHLYSLGHKHLAFLGPDPSDRSAGYLRLTAFKAVCQELSLQYDEQILPQEIPPDLAPYSYEYGYQMTMRLLTDWKLAPANKRFTALVAMTDVIAIGALKALIKSGLRVPEEVSVTGFDGINTAHYVHPELTTIVQPVTELIKQTVDLLFSHLGSDTNGKHVLLPGKIFVGGSTGKARLNISEPNNAVISEGDTADIYTRANLG